MRLLRTTLAPAIFLVCSSTMHAQLAWLPLGPDDANWPSLGDSHYQDIALDGSGNPVVAHLDGANGGLTVVRWNGAAWSVVGTPGISAGYAQYLSLALDAGGNPVVAYRDDANGGKTTVMRWNGAAWSVVALPAFLMEAT